MPQPPPHKRHPYDQWSPDARALDVVGDKWTLLIVRDLLSGPRRFVELQRMLPGISTEQLRSRLNRMVADEMLTRQRFREVPPRVEYALTDRARALAPVLAELARWGYSWYWSDPRPSEHVDVGAIFRLAPGLLTAPPRTGVVELELRGASENGAARWTLTLTEDGTDVAQRPAGGHDAKIEGDRDAWVAALSPSGERSRLSLSGERELAELVLARLAGSTARRW
jgi:DNA-binding HxlR family transcriptional regulator